MAKKSKKGSLNIQDLLKGLLLTVITAVLTGVTEGTVSLFKEGSFHIDLGNMVSIGVIAGASYLVKNLNENSKGQFMGQEP